MIKRILKLIYRLTIFQFISKDHSTFQIFWLIKEKPMYEKCIMAAIFPYQIQISLNFVSYLPATLAKNEKFHSTMSRKLIICIKFLSFTRLIFHVMSFIHHFSYWNYFLLQKAERKKIVCLSRSWNYILLDPEHIFFISS